MNKNSKLAGNLAGNLKNIRARSRALASCAFAALALVAGCAHPEVEAACKAAGECGDDISSCISAREAHLGETGGRCGDASDEAIAVYVCQGTLSCEERDDVDAYEAACAAELEAFRAARDAGDGGCEGEPDPVAP